MTARPRAGLPVARELDDGARRASLAQRTARMAVETRGGRAEWYHLGPVRTAARAEVVGDVTEQGAAPAEGTDTAVSTADVYVYDTIGGWWGMTADDFVRDVAGLDVERIVLHLNTPGGDVWEATAMANVLRQHRAEVIVSVDGIAASAGTILAMAGDEVIMGSGSQMMIHDAWSYSMGNAGDMRKAADMLDALSDAVADSYAERAGGTAQSWREVMVAETWYTADQAVAAGLADRKATAADKGSATGQQVVPGQSASLSFWDAWDSLGDPERHAAACAALYGSAQATAGAALFTPPGAAQARAPKPPTASAAGSTTARGGASVELPDEQVTQLRNQLGLPETADGGAILAALNTRLNAPAPAAAVPDGVVMMDRGALDELRASAQRGEAARAQQERDEREQLVNAAIADGRIARASAASWLTQLTPVGDGAVATSMRTVLADLPAGVVPVDAARGYTGDTGGESPIDNAADVRASAAYKGWSF